MDRVYNWNPIFVFWISIEKWVFKGSQKGILKKIWVDFLKKNWFLLIRNSENLKHQNMLKIKPKKLIVRPIFQLIPGRYPKILFWVPDPSVLWETFLSNFFEFPCYWFLLQKFWELVIQKFKHKIQISFQKFTFILLFFFVKIFSSTLFWMTST